MLVLDVKRTRQDFIKRKSKSSEATEYSYENMLSHFEKFCLKNYDSSLEKIIEELALVENCQEQVENLIQTYIDELETENKPKRSVSNYSGLVKNYLKFRRVKFDKDELDLSYKKEVKDELYPITKEEIKTLIDYSSFQWKTKILLMSSGGFRISELLGIRKSD